MQCSKYQRVTDLLQGLYKVGVKNQNSINSCLYFLQFGSNETNKELNKPRTHCDKLKLLIQEKSENLITSTSINIQATVLIIRNQGQICGDHFLSQVPQSCRLVAIFKIKKFIILEFKQQNCQETKINGLVWSNLFALLFLNFRF